MDSEPVRVPLVQARRRTQTRMRAARLHHVGACIEDVDDRAPRKLDRAVFKDLATGKWVDERRSLLITGLVAIVLEPMAHRCLAVGKTWLAVHHRRSNRWRANGPSSGRGPAGTASPCSTAACHGSSPNSSSPMATV
ncbi:MAG: ATP-binding protein [Pseudomonadota bacterium]